MLANGLQGVVLPAAGADDDGRAATVACEVLMPRRRSATSSARARPTRSTRSCRPARQFGMQTMDSTLANLVRQGVITMDMALERANHPDELKRLLGLVKAA